MAYNLSTRSGHNMFTMASLLQKAIRRSDKNRAGYAAFELFGSYHTMLWNRILTVSSEDCWGILTKEIVALRYEDAKANNGKKGYEKDTQYVSKAINLLCEAKKSRDACYYACNFMLHTYLKDPGGMSEKFLQFHTDEMNLVPEKAFDISEMSGEIKKWNPIETGRTGEQLSIFNLDNPGRDNTLYYFDSESKETKSALLSAFLRKAIRTLDMELAGYAVHHLKKMNMVQIWKTLYLISRNECEGLPTREIVSLRHADSFVNKNKSLDKRDEIHISKAIMILMYQVSGMYETLTSEENINSDYFIDWASQKYTDIKSSVLPDNLVPEWVYDVHTLKGKRAGKTDWEMNIVEYAALTPKEKGFFDNGSWQPRYEYKNLHGLCSHKEYLEMLEYSKKREGNPVKKINDKFPLKY